MFCHKSSLKEFESLGDFESTRGITFLVAAETFLYPGRIFREPRWESRRGEWLPYPRLGKKKI